MKINKKELNKKTGGLLRLFYDMGRFYKNKQYDKLKEAGKKMAEIILSKECWVTELSEDEVSFLNDFLVEKMIPDFYLRQYIEKQDYKAYINFKGDLFLGIISYLILAESEKLKNKQKRSKIKQKISKNGKKT